MHSHYLSPTVNSKHCHSYKVIQESPGIWIPCCGFRIPCLWISDPISGCSWIPDSTDRNYFDSGFWITLHEATYGVFSNNCESTYAYYFYDIQNRLHISSSVTRTLLIQTLTNENSQGS